ncbi:MAG TPA: DNA-3-methyladenine glycosylase I [Rhodospirillaceae bacterium]|nr:DNA-3-methyladenine glycosylase I [Rhodospirillaceae bacterium]HAA93336.1 DNA-3-methyladenine glycosylase I [Rhodospirillaceae bacterium]HAT34262.1 DNA-3-methyladenine glycosylase I [Rhodospirillaceae bacterium]
MTVAASLPEGPDGRRRCFGNKPGQDIYAVYHDTEWGVPCHDDRALFEMLILEGAQAGLSWETVLLKRDGYRAQFYEFEIERVAGMSDGELEAARENPAIIRNRLKIASTRRNARVFLDIQTECGSFDTYLWNFVGGAPLKGDWETLKEVPVTTPESDALSKDLKKRGMNFVGSTIIYAYMQATGLVNDHVRECWRHGQ